MTFGVPIARDAGLASVETLAVVGGDGDAVPSQLRVTSRWGARPEDAAAPMLVTQTTQAVAIDTGVLVATVSRLRGTILDSLRVAGVEQLDASDPQHGIRITVPGGAVLVSAADARVLGSQVVESGPVATTLLQQLEFDDARLRDESAESWGANTCFPWLTTGRLPRWRAICRAAGRIGVPRTSASAAFARPQARR